MIATLLTMSLVCLSYWLMYRGVQSCGAAPPPAVAATDTGNRGTGALGLEDDPDQWLGARGAWTALDEHQLTRMLTDAAPIIGSTTTSVDTAVPHIEHEDTP